jgi:hypothetical protein
VAGASGKGQLAWDWVKEVEDPESSFESLKESGTFTTLDVKLAAALNTAATGELGRKLTHLTEMEAQAGNMIKGRQCLFVIYE